MADEASKPPEEKEKPLVSISATVSDVFGHGQGASKLFETIGARLGQVFSGVGEFMNVFALNGKRAKNEAYHTRESPIIDSGQQVREIGIIEGKISAQLQEMPSELLVTQQRSNQRAALENVMHQHNIEAAVSYAVEELDGEQEVASTPVEQDWVTQWGRFAQDVSSEEMRMLWGKILAGEVKKPGSFSPRTLQFLSLLTQKEALLFQRVCAFGWREANGEISIVLIPGDNNIPIGFTYSEIQLLSNIGLIEWQATGSFVFDKIPLTLSYNASTIELSLLENTYRDAVVAGSVNLTQIGTELASICSPEYESGIMDETIKYWIEHDCQVSSPYIKYAQPAKPSDIR
jgi:hypothetical protein